MAKQFFKPIIQAYSTSLLTFIRFLRDRMPLLPGEGTLSPFEPLDEDYRK